MIKAIIVDDEERSRKNLAVLLTDFCIGVEVLATAKSVSEAIGVLEAHRPDVVFLDIQMQGETGFDLLSEIQQVDFEVIFTTAHAEYAISSIRLASVAYLLKPIDIGDLKDVITKIAERKRTPEELRRQVDVLLHNYGSTGPEDYTLALPVAKGMVFRPLKEVLYCEGQGNATQVHTQNGQYLVFKLLKEYDHLLTPYGFFRADPLHLVNCKEIKRQVVSEAPYIVMNDGLHIPVSPRKMEALVRIVSGQE